MKELWTWEQIKARHEAQDKRRAEEAERNLKRRVAEIDSHVRRALSFDHLSANDRGALNYAKQEVVPRWNDIESAMREIGQINPNLYRRLIRNLDDFTAGLVQGADKGGVTESAWRYVQKKVSSKHTEPGRRAAAGKQTKRDQLLDEHFGGLVDSGLNGQRLLDAVLELLAHEPLKPGLSNPSLRSVTAWATNYRRTGSWKPQSKASAQT
ncbi:hypothetical protein MKL09_09755 [Methylobacterium sp. J-048]|uniref:hypothetical protein n=1 Tax=Methylobacterium sp. J-048 TaxID=2836635 RepID=UPI001FB87C3A|nr:hypothetical protein [Methylobacterium sp. J-048]MCJ2056838.1 hypothetical protein [Methylobacterium sp. J-048]